MRFFNILYDHPAIPSIASLLYRTHFLYKSWLVRCFFTHLLILWITVVSLSSICSANVFSFLYRLSFLLRFIFFLFNLLTGFLWSMVKAYSVGTSICHTTNILTIYRFWIVQRFKPPSFLFRSSLSRQDFYRWFLRIFLSNLFYTNFDFTFRASNLIYIY